MRLRPGGLVAAGAATYAAGLGALAVLQHRAFWSGRFDLGNAVQAVWSTAHGDVLSVTALTGVQISRLGAHFEPLLVVFAPLWWLWPDASLLLVCQAAVIATGAVPLYRFGRKHLGSDWAAAGFALAYLLYPATQWLALDDFHVVALATPLLLWGFWFLDEDRLLPFAAVAAAAGLTKEQIGLVVAAMGLWYMLRPGRRWAGGAIAGAGLAVTVVAFAIVIPHYSISGSSRFEGRYSAIGGSPSGILETAVTDPGRILEAVSQGRDLGYLAGLLLPLLALPLVAPLAALTAAPDIALSLLSDTRTQTSIHFHYTAGAIPGLMVAAVLGAARLRRRYPWARRPEGRAIVIATLVAGLVLGPLPIWSHVPLGADLGAREHVVGEHASVARRALRLIPPSAPVSATNGLGAHLSERRRIFSFPILGDAQWVAVDLERPSYRDELGRAGKLRRAVTAIREDGRFRIVFDEDGVLVLHRDG